MVYPYPLLIHESSSDAMPLQSHIHLDTSLGGSPENAPVLKWGVTDRLDIPEVIISFERGLTGKLHSHVLTDSSGPVQFNNYRYTVRVIAEGTYTLEQRMAFLKAFHGKQVYLVDLFHANDGADHTNDIRTMIARIGEFAPVGPGLPYFDVDVELIDDDTV